jgi:hypothetical protein
MTRRYKPATAKITATYVLDLEPEEVKALETGKKILLKLRAGAMSEQMWKSLGWNTENIK